MDAPEKLLEQKAQSGFFKPGAKLFTAMKRCDVWGTSE
jgi:hypothetical protein